MKPTIRHYFKDRSGISAVYLFGSRAGGRQRPDSDVDLALLIHPEALHGADELLEKTVVDLGKITRKDIHPMILNSANETVLRQVLEKGECLLVNHPDHLSHFRSHAIVRIAEFGYYRRMIRRGFVRRVLGSVHG